MYGKTVPISEVSIVPFLSLCSWKKYFKELENRNLKHNERKEYTSMTLGISFLSVCREEYISST